ncbi:hypothetical protein HNP38_001200 [Chryseobacterium defluvii]|uniref:Resolvase HTH domain-containing protein n=1 Tax=Chryseobacterium defluvii TaxID=160396 RepID=A0A840KD50_9FLAO|nr:helix-turn-helix domain-containing protein [Chryseobacterium defluvii]MBB4805928.1 hypothetical protein [Chryseobacterium defluvii]
MYNCNEIMIGHLIQSKVIEYEIKTPRICNFLKCTEEEIEQMYRSEDLDTELLLRWSKLLKYDFFRIYSQHLMLYGPPEKPRHTSEAGKGSLPHFRKNTYTKEIIDGMLELLKSGKKTKQQIIREHGIPKTTLYKWINKYM